MAIEDALKEVARNLKYAPAAVVLEATDVASNMIDTDKDSLEPLLDAASSEAIMFSKHDARNLMDIGTLFAADYASDGNGKFARIDAAPVGEGKPGFFQRLKKNHPYVHKGLVALAVFGTLGLAAALAGCTGSPTVEKPKPGTNPSGTGNDLANNITCASYDSGELSTDEPPYHTGSLEVALILTKNRNVSVVYEIYDLNGIKVAKGNCSRVSTYSLVTDKFGANDIVTLKPFDMKNNQYILKIIAKEPGKKDTVAEFKTPPTKICEGSQISICRSNNALELGCETIFSLDSANITWSYKITELSGTLVKQDTLKPYAGWDDERTDGYIPIENKSRTYNLEVSYTLSSADENGQSRTYSSYIRLPFKLEGLINY